jgi:phage FluMu protein Com
MAKTGFMFECSCGEVVYGESAPEECPKCGSINEFVQLPEEIAEEREKDIDLELTAKEDFEDEY